MTIVAKTEPTPTQPVSIVPTITKAAPVQPTLTQAAPVQPTLTQAAPVQPTLTQAAPVQPTLKEYTHKSNSFSLSYPADWNLTEGLAWVGITATDQSANITIYVVNTGNELDAASFTNFVSAYEANDFSSYKNYKETKRDIQPDQNYALVTKTLDINQIPSAVATQYEQKGKVIYIETYMSTVSAASKWGPIFTQVVNSFKSNPAYAEDFVPYITSVLPYHDGKNLFTINVPDTWKFEKKGDNVISRDVSTSPDGNALVFIEETDLGKEATRPVADAEALKLVKDINTTARIAHIEALNDGTKTSTIQWSWAPQNGLIQAVSWFKGNGTVFYMITFVIGKDFLNIYQSTMNELMKTYTIPH